MITNVYEGVILAAGLSNRLNQYVKLGSKPLVEIFGIPLILYPISVLSKIGVTTFNIVVNKQNHKKIKSELKKYKMFKTRFIKNKHPELENGYSFFIGAEKISTKVFFLSMADHIYVPRVARKLLFGMRYDTDILIGSDSSPRFIDVEESTKLLVVNGKVIKIGKNLERYTHVDIGVFLVKKRVLQLLEKSHLKYPFGLSDFINKAIEEGYCVRNVDVKGDYWTEIDTLEDLEKVLQGNRRIVVERVLNNLRRTTLSPLTEIQTKIL